MTLLDCNKPARRLFLLLPVMAERLWDGWVDTDTPPALMQAAASSSIGAWRAMACQRGEEKIAKIHKSFWPSPTHAQHRLAGSVRQRHNSPVSDTRRGVGKTKTRPSKLTF